MSDRPESAAIRKPHVVSPALGLAVGGCLLGTVIAAGGHVLADRQKAALDTSAAAKAEELQVLQSALTDVSMTAPRLRLEELASLPLVPEFLFLAQDQPDSLDAEELKTYLQSVLDAAIQETGLSRIALVSAAGEELILAETLLSEDGDSSSLEVRAQIKDFEGSGEDAGYLTGVLPASKVLVLAPQSTSETQVTASTTQDRLSDGGSGLDIPASTRLLSLVAGLVTALIGLLGAVLLRRYRSA